jgi:hypothetical protein
MKCKKFVNTRFGKLSCFLKENHPGQHCPVFTGVSFGRAVVEERGPNRHGQATWWVRYDTGRTLMLAQNIRHGGQGISPRTGLSRTAEYGTAMNHYRWATDPNYIGYDSKCYGKMVFYSNWNTGRAASFATLASRWMRKHMPKPVDGKWQLHVGKNSQGIKIFAPGYISWEPMEDVHVRNKRRALADYSLQELKIEIERRKTTEVVKDAHGFPRKRNKNP